MVQNGNLIKGQSILSALVSCNVTFHHAHWYYSGTSESISSMVRKTAITNPLKRSKTKQKKTQIYHPSHLIIEGAGNVLQERKNKKTTNKQTTIATTTKTKIFLIGTGIRHVSVSSFHLSIASVSFKRHTLSKLSTYITTIPIKFALQQSLDNLPQTHYNTALRWSHLKISIQGSHQ